MDSIHLTLSIVDSEYYCGYYLLWIQSLSNVDLGSIYIISRYLNRPSEVSSYHPYSPYCFVNLNPIFGKKSSGDILGDMFHCVSSPVCLGQVLTIGATGTAAIAAPRGQPGAAGAAGTTQAGSEMLMLILGFQDQHAGTVTIKTSDAIRCWRNFRF